MEKIAENQYDDFMFLEMPSSSDNDEVIVEISFTKWVIKDNKNIFTAIKKAIPIWIKF
jgi:hypothetical protein